MKVCNKCKQSLEEEGFNFKNKSQNKRSTICRECQKVQNRDSYHKHKEETRDAFQRRRKLHRKNVREYAASLKDGGCIICGEKEISCLDFHHKDPTQKEQCIADMFHTGNRKNIEEEIKKCVILCANCHRKHHAGVLIQNKF